MHIKPDIVNPLVDYNQQVDYNLRIMLHKAFFSVNKLSKKYVHCINYWFSSDEYKSVRAKKRKKKKREDHAFYLYDSPCDFIL